MTVDWKVWAGAVMLMLAGAGWLYIGQLRAEKAGLAQAAEAARRSAAAAQGEAAFLLGELKKNHQALERRQAEIGRLTAEKEAQKTILCEVYANDQDAQDWGAAYVPDAVAHRLCRAALPLPGTPADSAPGRLSARCARARLANRDLANWALDLLTALRLSNRDKAALREWAGSVPAATPPAEP